MRSILWNVCAACFCLSMLSSCGKTPDDLKGIPNKAGDPKDESTTGKQGSAKPGVDIVRVTGEQLAADYKTNKDEADRKYRLKPLEVDAVVSKVFKQNGYLAFKALSGIQLQSTDVGTEILEKHPEIKEGTRIIFRATVGIVNSDVVNLDDFKFVEAKPGAQTSAPPSEDGADEAAASAAVHKLGGFTEGKPVTKVSLIVTKTDDEALKALAPLKKVEILLLTGTKVSNAGLGRITHMTKLKSLSLDDTLVDDDGLKRLSAFPSLESLKIGPTISDAGLAYLPALKSLRGLDVARSKQVTDAGLKHITAMKGLRSLRLAYTGVTDAGLKAVSSLDKLELLDLSGLSVTDAGLKQLAPLNGLVTLRLINTSVSDAGVEHLLALKGLKRLNLINTKITDTGLGRLVALTGLEELRLADTKVTNKGVEAFRKAIPKCSIER
jgi:Leucine Rich repeat